MESQSAPGVISWITSLQLTNADGRSPHSISKSECVELLLIGYTPREFIVIPDYPYGRLATQQFMKGIDVETIGQVTKILRRFH